MQTPKLPTLAIIGRPNVGKSTLFNRLIRQRRALVHDIPGVTRDRIERETEWSIGDRPFPLRLIDTGGIGGEVFADEIKRQVTIALSEADVAILVLDGRAGLLPADRELAQELLSSGLGSKIPVIAAVNKVDAEVHEEAANEFYELGIDPMFTIAAEHNRGIDDLQAAVLEALQKQGYEPLSSPSELIEEGDESEEKEYVARTPRIAVVGRPNVGKSTFINALLGQERMITSPIAGTTTDAVDSLVMLGGKEFLFVDTAGIRRKSKTEQGVEVLSVVQSKKAIERADLAILVLDGESGITDQDEKIGGIIEEAGCSVVLAVNKWDTQRRNRDFDQDDAAKRIRETMRYLKYAPILFMSAKEGEGFDDLGDLLQDILHQRQLRIPTHDFTEWVRKEAPIHNPRNAKFFLCHQAGRHPPTFVCHVNDPEKVHFSLKRHLVNALREKWGYMGTPIKLLFVEAKNRKSLPRK
ncbi:MAG: ribosome biogenesis GTPase Der [Bdellovibrionales bacterium GWB1_55_8]|nr:MAG: ribosome biogenesis GTPase Der [Bdellovibrionales bacterium GWB1_55_8]